MQHLSLKVETRAESKEFVVIRVQFRVYRFRASRVTLATGLLYNATQTRHTWFKFAPGFMSPVTWKTIPGFSRYEANELGEIRNQRTGRVLKTWAKSARWKRQKIQLIDDEGQVKGGLTLSRIVCAANEERWPEEYEHTCHIDGDCTNDQMYNLRFSDIINNAIDEVEVGRKETSKQYVELAIERLLALREKL